MQRQSLSCPSELLLDRLASEQLPREKAKQIRSHTEQCPTCKLRAKERRENLHFLATQATWTGIINSPYVLERQAQQPISHSADTTHPARGWWHIGLQWLQWGAVTAGLFLVCWLPLRQQSLQKPPQVVPPHAPTRHVPSVGNAKGAEPSVRMLHYHPGSQTSEWTAQGERLSPGDLVQFEFVFPQPMHLLVLSVGQSGESSMYVPIRGKASIFIKRFKGTWPRETSLELDHSIGFERIWMICDTRPINIARAKHLLLQAFKRSKGDLRRAQLVHPRWHLQSVLIEKVPTHTHKAPQPGVQGKTKPK